MSDVDDLLAAARAAMPAWRDAARTGAPAVCLEILDRLHARIFELANAVQHTSGQAFVMAFQAGGPHALDRALEAIAYAYTEMTRTPATALWEKPGKYPLRMEKTFTVVPRGVALVIGCNTFPTWNSWPGLFASLVTGNAVVVKPHPAAVLPLAITVQVCQEVLAEAGFDRNLVTLAAEGPDDRLAATLATRPEVTADRLHRRHRVRRLAGEERPPGGGLHREGRRQHRRHRLHRRPAGDVPQPRLLAVALLRPDVHHAAEHLRPDRRHRDRRRHRLVDEVGAGIGRGLDGLLGEDAKAVELPGAIVNAAVLDRARARPLPWASLVAGRDVTHPAYPDARVRTPMIVRLTPPTRRLRVECFGPVTFLVATD